MFKLLCAVLLASTFTGCASADLGSPNAYQRYDMQRVGQLSRRTTLARREAILGAAAKREEAELGIAREEAKFMPLQREIAELEVDQATLSGLDVLLATLQSDGRAKKAHLDVLNKQAAGVEQVPCVGHSMHASCPLLSQALQAKEQAATYVVSVADLREKYRAELKQTDELDAVPAKLAAKRVEMLDFTDEVSKLRRALQVATELAASKPLLHAAASGLEAAQAEFRSIAEEGAARTANFESEKARTTAELARIAAEATRLAAVDVTAAIATLDRDLAANREVLASLEGRIEALIRSKRASG
jgi:DNA repair protein SbcC/Rad50